MREVQSAILLASLLNNPSYKEIPSERLAELAVELTQDLAKAWYECEENAKDGLKTRPYDLKSSQ